LCLFYILQTFGINILFKTLNQKQMKISMIKSTSKNMTFLLVILLVGATACSTNQENVSDDTATSGAVEVVSKAPSMSIHEAAFMGNMKAIKEHIAAKSNLNDVDAYGSSPLTICGTFGKTEVALVLIKGGADVNARTGDGSTALHTAAFFGRTEIVEALLKAGADVTIRNNYGATALESVAAPFSDVKMIYDQFSKDLGPLGLKLDYDALEKDRPVIAEMIKNATKDA
jgi:hypothetical protein